MSLCKYCTNIPAKLFSFRREDQTSYEHQPNFPALKESATVGGCPGCRLFLHAVESNASEHAGKYALDKQWTDDEIVGLCSTKFGWQEVRVGWRKAGVFRGFALPAEWRDFPVLTCSGQLADDRNNSTDHYLSYEARLIQRWSEICLDTHNCCSSWSSSSQSTSSSFLPSRVIDVGTSSEPNLLRLVESASIDSDSDRRYLALSHCWGLSMPDSARTVLKTLGQNLASINLDDLPLTFRDFIKISRLLGVRYVWIDSLCIIQDSREDWAHEAALMAEIYSKAYLTIAASGSSDSSKGCHVKNEFRSYGPLDVSCAVQNTDTAFSGGSGFGSGSDSAASTTTTKTFRLWSRDPFPIEQVLSSDPLSGRGWTFQERELSSRMVFYSRDTIRWECAELRATLEFPWADYGAFDAGRLFDGGSLTRPTVFGPPQIGASIKSVSDESRKMQSWLEAVGRYTSRRLTKQEDVLPALSGISRRVAEQMGFGHDQYLAGLWKGKHLGHCLVWASDWHVGRGFATHSRPEAPKLLAPSWSWASIKGPVTYLSWINGAHYSFNDDPDPEYTPRLIAASLEPEYEDPFGPLKEGGWIEVEGKVGVGMTIQEKYAKPLDEFGISYTPGFQDRQAFLSMNLKTKQFEKMGEIRHDVPLCDECSPVGTYRITWLLCCVNSKRSADGSMRTAAIVLEDDEGKPQFRRAGVAWGIDAKFWETAMTRTLKIV